MFICIWWQRSKKNANVEVKCAQGLIIINHHCASMKQLWTRMYSSGMRTAHLLTVSQHALVGGVCVSQHALGRGVCIPACSGQEGVCPGGVADPLGPEADTPLWTDRQLWKHNLRKLRLRAVMKHFLYRRYSQEVQSFIVWIINWQNKCGWQKIKVQFRCTWQSSKVSKNRKAPQLIIFLEMTAWS